MFSLCLYSHRDRKPRHTGPPQKGPFQDEFFTKSGRFWPPRTPIQPNTSFTAFGWNRSPLLSLYSSVERLFCNSQNLAGIGTFGQKWPFFNFLKSKNSLLNYYRSLELWFLFQPNTVNEVFGWNRNRYISIVPIPAKHPV